MSQETNELDFDNIKSLKLANEIEKEIEESYKKFGIKVALSIYSVNKPIYKYKVNLRGKTQISSLEKYKEDVRIRAKLLKLYIVKERKKLFIIASKKEIQINVDLIQFIYSSEYPEVAEKLNIAHPIGIDDQGNPVVQDLTLYPHLLIAGTTRSGKSVSLTTLLITLIVKYPPEFINLLICDPLGDLLIFNNIPHLVCPVITDFQKFYHALKALYCEMERRIRLKQTSEYDTLPYVIFVVDEFISLISGNDQEKKDARTLVGEILRQGRHARIHVVLVAFNPTKQNLKLDISDLPTKMVFRVSNLHNSVSVLGTGGAEKLSGNGEMLFQSSREGELKKIKGFYILPEELEKSLKKVRNYWQNNEYDYSMIFKIKENTAEIPKLSPICPSAHANELKLYAQAIVWAMQQSSISCNQLMQNFGIGWNKARTVMTKLEEFGIIGDLESKLPRKVLTNSLSEISEEIMEFLKSNGYSEKKIINILQLKEGGK